MSNRPQNFKNELIALLKKYDAQMLAKEGDTVIDCCTIEIFFNSQWENDGRINIDECHTLNLGNDVVP